MKLPCFVPFLIAFICFGLETHPSVHLTRLYDPNALYLFAKDEVSYLPLLFQQPPLILTYDSVLTHLPKNLIRIGYEYQVYSLTIYITALSSATAAHPCPDHHIAKLWPEAAPAENPQESIPSESRSTNPPAATEPRIYPLSLFTKLDSKTAPNPPLAPSASCSSTRPLRAHLIGGVRCTRYRGIPQVISDGRSLVYGELSGGVGCSSFSACLRPHHEISRQHLVATQT